MPGSRVGEREVQGEEAHVEAGVRLGLLEKVAWSKDVREAGLLWPPPKGQCARPRRVSGATSGEPGVSVGRKQDRPHPPLARNSHSREG